MRNSCHGTDLFLLGYISALLLVRLRYDGKAGPVFCLLLGVSSDYAQPITGQVTEVTCPVIGWAQPELTLSKRQKMGLDFTYVPTYTCHDVLNGNDIWHCVRCMCMYVYCYRPWCQQSISQRTSYRSSKISYPWFSNLPAMCLNFLRHKLIFHHRLIFEIRWNNNMVNTTFLNSTYIYVQSGKHPRKECTVFLSHVYQCGYIPDRPFVIRVFRWITSHIEYIDRLKLLIDALSIVDQYEN